MGEKQYAHPEIWDDETRMTVLFSQFRDRNLNPKSWEQKVKFWSEEIVFECRQCGQAVIDLKTLPSKFRRKGRTPVCLGTVLQEMKSSGQLKTVSQMQRSDSSGWLSWGFNKLVKAPVGWGLSWLYGQQSESTDREMYVFPELIKEKAESLLQQYYETCSDQEVMEYSELHELFQELCPSDVEFQLVINELCDTKQIAIQKVDNKLTLIKFPRISGSKTKTNVEPITEQDKSILRIQRAHGATKKQIEKLEDDIKLLTKEALSFKKQGLKRQAINVLRKRKLKQQNVDKLTGSLDMLEGILHRIKQAESDQMVVQAIQGGTTALKEMMGKKTLEDVTGIMDDLADVTQEQDDIMSELSFSTNVDEPSQQELEDELESILGYSSPAPPDRIQQQELDDLAEELQDFDLQLPDVPTFSPTGSKDNVPAKKLRTEALYS